MKLVATIEAPIEDIRVHFRVWDVDDPFDQNNAAMSNVRLVDGDTSGPDNRLIDEPSDQAVGTYTATTDDNDKVKHQTPGNLSHLPSDLIETIRRRFGGQQPHDGEQWDIVHTLRADT